MKENGKEPVQFILDAFDTHDLIIFDDAPHTAVEPFLFYDKLINNKEFQIKAEYIFL